ncbi:TlpA family protein disulfide reductase [Tenacibaculum sp. MEBiC06402]|uniref:TlpA family protein disulfide reductase n=1 Tax=unclassified Tenacibaculum TaxID=2635139 RepID=UPI003B9AEDED
MKNILITIVTMAVAFGITFYILTNFYEQNNNELDFISDETTALTTSSDSDDSLDDDDSDDEYNDDITNINADSDTDNDSNNDLFPDVETILSNYPKWETYYNKNINLSSDFIALDNQGKEIEKGDFLSDLTSGSFAPIKLLSGNLMYQLHNIEDVKDQKIITSVKNEADLAYAYFNKIGSKLPEFNFSDINGNRFSSASTDGKIIILTCWETKSKASINEFPQLNKLYDKYEAYEDVVFLSFATDKSSKLLEFLAKNELRHPVVANKESYMKDQVGVRQFPTHLIVDEDGNIEKMVSNFSQLEAALEKIAEPDLTNLNEPGM